MEEYIAPLWIVIFLFFALMVLFILSKLMIIRAKLKVIDSYIRKIEELYTHESDIEGEGE